MLMMLLTFTMHFMEVLVLEGTHLLLNLLDQKFFEAELLFTSQKENIFVFLPKSPQLPCEINLNGKVCRRHGANVP
jgi:hypothetical protein